MGKHVNVTNAVGTVLDLILPVHGSLLLTLQLFSNAVQSLGR